MSRNEDFNQEAGGGAAAGERQETSPSNVEKTNEDLLCLLSNVVDKYNALNKSLRLWLETSNIENTKFNEITQKMKEFGYTEEELSYIYAQLSLHGRLFLNSLLRACRLEGVSDPENKLEPLSRALKDIEHALPPVANFIWVGQPRDSEIELLGLRSLSKARKNQPIYFWVLEEYVTQFRENIRKDGLLNVHVVSIENQAKKSGIVFEDGSSLSQQIEYLKELSATAEDPIDKIRHRVTIVDYIKCYIPRHTRSGYVFDADIIFASLDHSLGMDVLPPFSRWTFPLFYAKDSSSYLACSPDVFFFQYITSKTWKDEIQEAANSEATCQEVNALYNKRCSYLDEYHLQVQLLRKSNTLNSHETSTYSLCCAIVNIHGCSPWWENIHDENGALLFRTASKLNGYVKMDDHTYTSATIHETPWCFFDGRMLTVKITTHLELVKYMNNSHRNSERGSKYIADLHKSLIIMKKGYGFQTALSQRIQYTNFDVNMRFDARVILDQDGERNEEVNLNNITMAHLALIVRPDLFGDILKEMPEKKISELLHMVVDIPEKTFEPDKNSPGAEKHTLLSLATRLAEIPAQSGYTVPNQDTARYGYYIMHGVLTKKNIKFPEQHAIIFQYNTDKKCWLIYVKHAMISFIQQQYSCDPESFLDEHRLLSKYHQSVPQVSSCGGGGAAADTERQLIKIEDENEIVAMLNMWRSNGLAKLEVVRRKAVEHVQKLSEKIIAATVEVGFFAGSDKLRESASEKFDLTDGAAKP